MHQMRGKGIKIICQWSCIGVFLVFLGVCFPVDVWGTCTPGYSTGGVWLGGFVPYQVFPSMVGSHRGSNNYGAVTDGGATQCCSSSYEEWYGQTGNPPCVWNYAYGKAVPDAVGCPPPTYSGYAAHTFCYAFSTSAQSGHDYDCDGMTDDIDPDPNHVPTGNFMKSQSRHKTLDAVFTFYTNVECVLAGGTAEECQYVRCDGTDCASVIAANDQPADRPGDYNTDVDMGTNTWAGWFGGNESGTIPSSGLPGTNTSGELGGLLSELRNIDGTERSVKGVLDDIYLRQNNQTGSLTGKIDDLISKEGEVKQAIIDKNLSVDMSGVNTRLDTVHSDLGTANSTLTDIKNNMVTMGTGDLPDGSTDEMNDDSSFGEVATTEKYNLVKDDMDSWLGTFLSSNPVLAWVTGTGVEYSGAITSLSWNMMGQTYVIDASWLGSKLDEVGIGTFFMALCTFAGISAVLRD